MKKDFSLYALSDRELSDVTAGVDQACACGCAYINCGGSASNVNRDANFDHGYTTTTVGDASEDGVGAGTVTVIFD